MLTKQQKYLLAQLVRENKEILLRKFGSPGVTKKRKEQIWESIRQELLGMLFYCLVGNPKHRSYFVCFLYKFYLIIQKVIGAWYDFV
jgi:hypothetical protein